MQLAVFSNERYFDTCDTLLFAYEYNIIRIYLLITMSSHCDRPAEEEGKPLYRSVLSIIDYLLELCVLRPE